MESPISQRFRFLRRRLAVELLARGIAVPTELSSLRLTYPFPVNAWQRQIQALSNPAVKTAPLRSAGTPLKRRPLPLR